MARVSLIGEVKGQESIGCQDASSSYAGRLFRFLIPYFTFQTAALRVGARGWPLHSGASTCLARLTL